MSGNYECDDCDRDDTRLRCISSTHVCAFFVSNRIERVSATMMLHLAKDIQYAVVESTLHLAKDIQYAVVDSPPRLY